MAFPDDTYTYYSFDVDNANVDSDLTDRPVRCDLANLPTAVREWLEDTLDANGDGIRVTNESNTILSYTLENFAKSGGVVTGELVFKCSPTSASALGLRLFADSSAANAEDQSNTYNSAYDVAWNFEQDPSGSAPQLTDVTGNGYNGSSSGSMTSGDLVSSGLFGKAIDFDGTNDRFTFGSNWPSATTDVWSVLTWVKSDVISSSGGKAIINQDGAGWDDSFQHGLVPEGTTVNTNKRFACNHQDTASTVRTIVTDTTDAIIGQWYQVVTTSDGDDLKLYVDGANVATTAKNGTYLNIDSRTMVLGNRAAGGSRYWNGQMCFVGLSESVAFSADWIKFEYHNMTSSDNELINFTLVEPSGGGSQSNRILRPIYNSCLRQVV